MTTTMTNRFVELTDEQQVAINRQINHVASGGDSNPDEHNGWVNRETWACALHLSNDQSLYDYTRRLVADSPYPARPVEEFVTENVDRLLFPIKNTDEFPDDQLWLAMISDVGSFWRVDWNAVAKSFKETS